MNPQALLPPDVSVQAAAPAGLDAFLQTVRERLAAIPRQNRFYGRDQRAHMMRVLNELGVPAAPVALGGFRMTLYARDGVLLGIFPNAKAARIRASSCSSTPSRCPATTARRSRGGTTTATTAPTREPARPSSSPSTRSCAPRVTWWTSTRPWARRASARSAAAHSPMSSPERAALGRSCILSLASIFVVGDVAAERIAAVKAHRAARKAAT